MGKNLTFWCCVCTQLCPTLCDLLGCSPPVSSVHGVSQARIREWVAMPSSRKSSRLRDQSCVSCIGKRILHHRTTWEASHSYGWSHIRRRESRRIPQILARVSLTWLLFHPGVFSHVYLCSLFKSVSSSFQLKRMEPPLISRVSSQLLPSQRQEPPLASCHQAVGSSSPGSSASLLGWLGLRAGLPGPLREGHSRLTHSMEERGAFPFCPLFPEAGTSKEGMIKGGHFVVPSGGGDGLTPCVVTLPSPPHCEACLLWIPAALPEDT